jgi:hypothetical protein
MTTPRNTPIRFREVRPRLTAEAVANDDQKQRTMNAGKPIKISTKYVADPSESADAETSKWATKKMSAASMNSGNGIFIILHNV